MKLIPAILAAAALALASPVAANPEANRASAVAFYDALIVSKKGAAAARAYMAADFLSHSPSFPKSDADTFLGPADEAAKDPNSPIAQWKVKILRTVAEGDFVVIHARGDAGGKVYHIVDILRFNDQGKIAEHWDIIQDVTKAANPAGAF
jgi:predicted SnoaL-like aldol condensation-catalyzing enzyme